MKRSKKKIEKKIINNVSYDEQRRIAYSAQLALMNARMHDNVYLHYLIKHIGRADLKSTIAIQIPSYCDPELMNTIRSAIANATSPDRLRFIVCYQDDDEQVLTELKAIPNCKVIHIAKDDAPGLCAARSICNKAVSNEKYVLHIDSHMRFPKFWDTCMISLWEQCNDKKAIITAYAIQYSDMIDEPLDSDAFVKGLKDVSGRFINAMFFADDSGKLRFMAKKEFEKTDTAPRKAAFVSGHFIFAKSEIDKIVPSDPDMFFIADEITMAARYWTHGYNIYQPHITPIYHLFARDDVLKEKKGIDIQRFNSLKTGKCSTESDRMEKLFGIRSVDVDLGRYGLGTERTLDEYEQFAGIDIKNGRARLFAVRGAFDTEHNDREMWWYNIPGAMSDDHYNDTILVMIPVYDDKRIIPTVRSFIRNAHNPERVYFSICLYGDEDCSILNELMKNKHCFVTYRKTSKFKGISDTLNLLESTCGKETYTLITESAMYAVKDWDKELIRYASLCGDNAVISDWCGGFDYDNIPTNSRMGMGIKPIAVQGNNHIGLRYGEFVIGSFPARGAFAINQCMFAKTDVFRECRHDPNLTYWMSETGFALSLWTHGYDVYHSPESYIYKCYDSSMPGDIPSRTENSEDRLAVYIGLIDSDKIDMGEFGPGSKRTIKMFEHFTGLSFGEKTIDNTFHKGYVR